ncbi:MAG: CBS domain-containing protein [Chloroflexi bacterium]|nr:CBS domain-containing protein [Chloroflexota bacterium]
MPRGKTGSLRNILSHLSHTPLGMLDMTGEAGDVMIRDVISVRPDTPLVNVIQTMIDKKIKRIVVADAEKRLAGMISRESILRALA